MQNNHKLSSTWAKRVYECVYSMFILFSLSVRVCVCVCVFVCALSKTLTGHKHSQLHDLNSQLIVQLLQMRRYSSIDRSIELTILFA